jgi:hypothetical protein
VLLDSDHGTRIVSDLDLDVLTAFNRAALTPVANPYAAPHSGASPQGRTRTRSGRRLVSLRFLIRGVVGHSHAAASG